MLVTSGAVMRPESSKAWEGFPKIQAKAIKPRAENPRVRFFITTSKNGPWAGKYPAMRMYL
jgi:hypothetical protein